MPPWKANRAYSHFADERYLTNAEIDIISRWVDGGMPEGVVFMRRLHQPIHMKQNWIL
jgi:hypothetical protein